MFYYRVLTTETIQERWMRRLCWVSERLGEQSKSLETTVSPDVFSVGCNYDGHLGDMKCICSSVRKDTAS